MFCLTNLWNSSVKTNLSLKFICTKEKYNIEITINKMRRIYSIFQFNVKNALIFVQLNAFVDP